MNNLRIYGTAPFNIALVHGRARRPRRNGPRSANYPQKWRPGTFANGDSIDGQVEELKDVLETHGTPPADSGRVFLGCLVEFYF